MGLPELLFHYTTEQRALEIQKSGLITPSDPKAYLSVDMHGEFTTGTEYRGMSETPNIFVTDLWPEAMTVAPQGILMVPLSDSYVVTLQTERIQRQGFDIFKNPSSEYEHIYNIPVQKKEGIRISAKQVRKV